MLKSILSVAAAAVVFAPLATVHAQSVSLLSGNGNNTIYNLGTGFGSVAWSPSASSNAGSAAGVQDVLNGDWIWYNVATDDNAINTASINPSSASITIDYQVLNRNNANANPSTLSLQLGLCDDQYDSNSCNLTATAPVISDGAWHTATFDFQGWNTTPYAGEMLTTLDVKKDAADFWSSEAMTLNIDNVVFASPVPEPGTLSLLGLGSLGLLARRHRSVA